ncbi:helix-hairpin-helix domain-containing protein [Bacteroidales bacterium OttesenSCG-928-M06]|nr:helix-hairpin-helix domain-containing protein [Bacteroidales bacterium OttesenSCG-928-M06]
MWQDFFYFSKRERQGILVLLIFIGGILVGKYLFAPKLPDPLIEQEFAESEMQAADSFEVLKKETYQPFVPQQKNIKTSSRQESKSEKRTYYAQGKDTLIRPLQNNYPKTEKLKAGSVLELNTADTIELKKIPGVGSAYAKRIVGYRNALGGFYRIEQLQEVYGMYEELYEKIVPFFVTNEKIYRQLDINTASLDQLRNHPYLNFYQAKAIIEIRKKKTKLENIEELILLEEFSEDDWMRIKPYLSF